MTDNFHPPIKCPTCGKSLAFIEYATKVGKNGKIAKWPVYEKCDKKQHSQAVRVAQHDALKKQETEGHKPILKPSAATEQVLNTDYAKAELRTAAITTPSTAHPAESDPSLIWPEYRAPFGAMGVVYQVPHPTRDGEARITIAILQRLVEKYQLKFDCKPKCILVSPMDNAKRLELEAPDDFPMIETASFLTPGYGYVMLEHTGELTNQINPTRSEHPHGK